MRASIKALLRVAAAAMLVVVAAGGADAQKYDNGRAAPAGGDGGHRGPGWGVAVPGMILAVPGIVQPNRETIDDGPIDDGPRKPKKQAKRAAPAAPQRAASGAPPAGERRYVPNEVVVELPASTTPQQVDALQARHRLTRLETLPNRLGGTTVYRWRIPAGTSVTSVIRALEAENAVASAQPNYRYTLQQADAKMEAKAEGDPAQYELAKLRLPQAHALTRGDNVLVAVIDSGVDRRHRELDGSIADDFNALGTPTAPNKHGTAVAGLIAAHGKLIGAAPQARILAVRAFDPAEADTEGTTFAILKGLDWAAGRGARIVNMSFAGPNDPVVHRSLTAAYRQGIVLIAAAGNAGPKSPPLYPGAYPEVIAVSGTDIDNKPSVFSNRGGYIAVAAPATDILVAIPGGGYDVSSGTSFSAAEISGVVALMLARRGDLSPDKVREILQATARDIGPKGRDVMFGAGLVDAFGAIGAEDVPVAAETGKPGGKARIERVSTQPR